MSTNHSESRSGAVTQILKFSLIVSAYFYLTISNWFSKHKIIEKQNFAQENRYLGCFLNELNLIKHIIGDSAQQINGGLFNRLTNWILF